MKTAFAYWDNRIAPVFDTARQIHIVESDGGRVVRKEDSALPDAPPWAKAHRLADLGIETLVCGAISRSLAELVAASGIEVVSFVTGGLDEVVGAALRGGLWHHVFAMPGCPDQGRRFRGWRHSDHEAVGRINTPGRPMGAGRLQGRGRLRSGPGSGPAGRCACPTCGHTEAHIPGIPCVERTCPACGAIMRRQ